MVWQNSGEAVGCPSLGVLGTCLHHVREGFKVAWCCQRGAGETCAHSTSVSRLEHLHEGVILKLLGVRKMQT